MFALDPVEAWDGDFARVVDQGIVDSWNDMVCPVHAVVPTGWNQAVNVLVGAQTHCGMSIGDVGSESIH